MATDIPIGTSAYFTDFENGQGAGAADYFTYAADLDTNFNLLRTTVNQLNAEVSAVGGPNATLSLDLMQYDDPNSPIGLRTAGIIGVGSYFPVRQTADTELLVEVGTALVGSGQKAESTTPVVLAASPLSDGTAYLAIDANGIPSISNTPLNKTLDLYTVPVASGVYTADPTLVAEVFLDGDFLADFRVRPQAGTTFPAKTFDNAVDRVRDIELLLSGGIPDPGGNIAIPPGTAALPGLVFADGAGGEDSTTGWYRSAANVWSWAGAATERFRLTSAGQFRIIALGSSAAPALAGGSGNAAGLFFPTSAEIGFVAATAEVLRFTSGTARAGANGTAALPFWTWQADPNTGIYRIGADNLGISTAGNLALEITPEGQVNLPLQGAAIVSRSTAQTILASTLTLVTWTVEDLDRTGWITVPATALTVPTGFGGLYVVSAFIEWSETGGGANTGDRVAAILVNSTETVALRLDSAKSGATKQPVTTALLLADADTIELQVFQDSSSSQDLDVSRLGLARLN